MGLEFEKYYERRKSVDAIRLVEISQAEECAQLLHSNGGTWARGWSISHRYDSFTLTAGDATMERGDYLVRVTNGYVETYCVVPSAKFHGEWQKPEWE